MALDLSALNEAVSKIDNVKDSVLAFVAGMSAKLADLAAKAVTDEDKAAIQAAADELKADGDAIAAAITSNT